jgi:hypothetical protein
MATSICPGCGAVYAPGVDVCPTCGVLLDGDTLVYEMEGWEPEERRSLDLMLDSCDVPHRWEGDDLIVPAADEERVDEVLDAVEYPDALEPVDDEGDDDEEVYAVMSDLFVAADRVAGERVVDVDQAGDLVAAASAASSTPPPYGVEAGVWTQVQQLGEGIAAAIENEADDEVIVRDAATLRDILRRHV